VRHAAGATFVNRRKPRVIGAVEGWGEDERTSGSARHSSHLELEAELVLHLHGAKPERVGLDPEVRLAEGQGPPGHERVPAAIEPGEDRHRPCGVREGERSRDPEAARRQLDPSGGEPNLRVAPGAQDVLQHVLAAGIGGSSLGRIWSVVGIFVVILVLLVIILQTTGLAPAIKAV
jgi:hypothetical protein